MKITDDLKEFVINSYVKDKISATKIAKAIGTTAATVCSYLRDNGIVVENRQNKLNFDLDLDIIPKYNQGISLSKLAKKYETTVQTLSKKLKERGIEIINRQNLTKFNENVFDIIDTEEKAYWLGFIFADGYISSRDNGFELSLSAEDTEHLVKFNTFMQHNKDNVKIGKVKCGDKEFTRCRWGIVNKHLWNTLNDYGCVPKKSNILEFPNLNIFQNRELVIAFIRGYFDGDGCITAYTNRKLKTSFLGTESFLTTLKQILLTYSINTGVLVVDPREEYTRTLNVSQPDTLQFLHLIYKDSTIYLTRKYNKYLTFCRSLEKSDELLQTNIGESCDANTEITGETKEFPAS